MNHKIEHYQNFLKIVDKYKLLFNLPALNPNEEYLLNEIIKHWTDNNKLTVKAALRLNKSCSASTNFKYLKYLRKNHLLEIETDEFDNRVKYIKPSALALNYFSSIDEAMLTMTVSVD